MVVAAPSGAGKTTICERILRDFPSTFGLSISTTTRPQRPGEVEGQHYFFVTPEAFEQKIKAGQFAEWARVHGNLYGTSKATIENHWAHGKHILFDIDVQGARSLKTQYPKETLAQVFILPPSMPELEERLGSARAIARKRLKRGWKTPARKWPRQKLTIASQTTIWIRAYAEMKRISLKECPVSDRALPQPVKSSPSAKIEPTDIHGLLDSVRKYYSKGNLDIIQKAYDFSKKAHRGKAFEWRALYLPPGRGRPNSCDLQLDAATVVTGLLHDTVEDTSRPSRNSKRIRPRGRPARRRRHQDYQITFQTSEEKQAENFRKMVLAMAKISG